MWFSLLLSDGLHLLPLISWMKDMKDKMFKNVQRGRLFSVCALAEMMLIVPDSVDAS